MADTFKFRIDHHGSLVRPQELLDARRRRAQGGLDGAGLRAVEDQAVADAVRAQRRLSLSVVTDGEFRREDFRGAVLDAVTGFRRTGATEDDGLARWVADGEPKAGGPLIADQVAAVAALTVVPAKATLPSPAYLAGRCFDPDATPFGSARELGDALARIVRDEIGALIARGVRCVQLTNPDYAHHLSGGGAPGLGLADALAVDAAAVAVGDKPSDVRIGLCPAHRAPAEVAGAVAERLFTEVPVDRWILPYCAGTEAETRLLRAVPADRDVCLGIVDPAAPGLEDVDTIMDRMDVAAACKDIDDLAVSPSAGFSDVAGRAPLRAEDQWRKLVHVETIARMCWGNEL
ncbi:methionine synthase II (cobalamin-independent)-like protein [Streptomyces sp. RFCAC02]|uniref:methionine synthase II (cobalamin-independent)-like protein n=1 Tax=Streptomyces sp. RFCAC02 TaxID=2499143 RepID=UPI00101F8EBD|nr:methionine synthase II (cobalamin-independent)-like protein [Streptomyces sp. RFCAC02]